jgi:hypothetical protein
MLREITPMQEAGSAQPVFIAGNINSAMGVLCREEVPMWSAVVILLKQVYFVRPNRKFYSSVLCTEISMSTKEADFSKVSTLSSAFCNFSQSLK